MNRNNVWVLPLKDLQPNAVIRNRLFSLELITRIQRLSEAFKGIYDPPGGLNGWVEGFQRDVHPEKEVAIWEKIAKAINHFSEGRDLSTEMRQELLRSALTHGYAPCQFLTPEDVLAFNDILRRV